ncbi:hypothetical protein FKG94_03245 [Exilibacterium tricleocarpae]|uniref:Uncharacterized protein n=1 Tax=Exilibacterium tricleocarpae TaxID=2591008 RepID=A0A545U6X1_9GAMM|nr:hypothetical protein [Exilibacterium tricleocarpae]TQV85219.1 hypothetical protein FKG94_03245 [Exilibacterium tricleocarpae]
MANLHDIKRQTTSMIRWLHVLDCGLHGDPAQLGSGQGSAFQKCMERMGFTLLSKTQAAKENLALKPQQKPIVRRYYDAPISAYYDLYLIEQFNAKKSRGRKT